jgi:hypothetical protein
MDTHMHFCKNCEQSLRDEDNYCPNCGQRAKDELTIRVLFSNTISNYFSVDARFFVSFIPLLFRPGSLPRKFVEGKRLKYLHPAQFYLFISVIFFFLVSIEARQQQEAFDRSLSRGFAHQDTINSEERTLLSDSIQREVNEKLKEKGIYSGPETFSKAELDSVIESQSNKPVVDLGVDENKLDSLIAVNAPVDEKIKLFGYDEGDAAWKRKIYIQILKLYEKRGGGLLEAFYDTIPVAMFFLLPIYALILNLFFLRKGRYSHHLVFSFYFFSFLFTVFSILMIANFIYPVPNWIDWIIILGTGVYLIIAIKRFYGVGIFVSLVKTAFLSFLYLMIVLPVSFVILAVVSFLIY